VIFQTNMRTARAAGKWHQIQRLKTAAPYIRYVARMDEKTRPEHAAWHNTILPADDPWWETHFPPNGWNCRCDVEQLNARDVDRYELSVSEEAPPTDLVHVTVKGKGVVAVPRGIDAGFAYNPGRSLLPP
jgi:SPP1 gp7 family putative phage head morphogenesis protein